MAMNLKDKTERVSTAGHPAIERIDAKPMNDQINKKIRENLISGRWHPDTTAEFQFLREYRKQEELKKC